MCIRDRAKTPYNILLLAGNYTAKLYNKNYFYSIESNSIEFTISTPEPTTYAITLNANGGTINSGNITSYTYGIGATLPTDVTRECYNFLGWYDNEEYTGTAVTEISASETGDKTYYAQWEKAAPYIDASAEKDGTEYILSLIHI